MTSRIFVGAGLLSVLAAFGVSNDASAEAPSSNVAVSPSNANGGGRCVVALEKLRPGETVSRVFSVECATGNTPLSVEPAADTLLMTWYDDINFNDGTNGWSTRVVGHDGPCDDAGYGISDVGNGWATDWPWPGFWNDRISSFKAWNYCNNVTGYFDINYGGHSQNWYDPGVAGMEINYVGDVMNDQISSFTLKRGNN